MKYFLKILGILLAGVILINLAFGASLHVKAAETPNNEFCMEMVH